MGVSNILMHHEMILSGNVQYAGVSWFKVKIHRVYCSTGASSAGCGRYGDHTTGSPVPEMGRSCPGDFPAAVFSCGSTDTGGRNKKLVIVLS
jgi:hypothetical protein